jgi:hypothetical protein
VHLLSHPLLRFDPLLDSSASFAVELPLSGHIETILVTGVLAERIMPLLLLVRAGRGGWVSQGVVSRGFVRIGGDPTGDSPAARAATV